MDGYIINLGSPRDKNYLPLATRKGTPIPNAIRYESPPEWHKTAIAIDKTNHSQIDLRSATAVYNCLGMVFGARRTWIDEGFLKQILLEDDYRPVLDKSSLRVGDIVIYRHDDNSFAHIGIITQIQIDFKNANRLITVMSKWGQHPEYFHVIDDVPLRLGKPKEFWTDRKEIP